MALRQESHPDPDEGLEQHRPAPWADLCTGRSWVARGGCVETSTFEFGGVSLQLAMNFNKGPFGGHHLGGDSCPPITFEVVPLLKFMANSPRDLF